MQVKVGIKTIIEYNNGKNRVIMVWKYTKNQDYCKYGKWIPTLTAFALFFIFVSHVQLFVHVEIRASVFLENQRVINVIFLNNLDLVRYTTTPSYAILVIADESVRDKKGISIQKIFKFCHKVDV